MKKYFLLLIINFYFWQITPISYAQSLPLGQFTISSINTSQITDTSATINWITSLPGSGMVEYGTTTAYGSSSSENSTLLLIHMANLNGLNPGTVYHYRITSTDELGTTQSTSDRTFTTTCNSCANPTPDPSLQPTPPPPGPIIVQPGSTTTNNTYNAPSTTSTNSTLNPNPTPPLANQPSPAPISISTNSQSAKPSGLTSNPVSSNSNPITQTAANQNRDFYHEWWFWLIVYFLFYILFRVVFWMGKKSVLSQNLKPKKHQR